MKNIEFRKIHWTGFVISLLWMVPISALIALASMDAGAFYVAAISMCFGLIGAPPLAALFTLIYKRFDRD